MEYGDIVLVRFPFSNMIDYKIRPALVISTDDFNKKFDVWICPITSKKTLSSISLKKSFSEGKLDKESFVKTNVVTTADDGLIIKKIGKITKEKLNEVIEKIIQNIKTE